MIRHPRRALLWLWLILLPGCADPVGRGFDAYEAGRFRDARAAFAEAEAAAGDAAGPDLLYDRALAALHAGELRDAEWSAEKLAVRGGPDAHPRRDRLLGHVAWRRAVIARAEAELMEADPTAIRRAVLDGQAAVAAFRRAVLARPDWLDARKDLERAQRGLVELEALAAEAERKRKQQQVEEEKTPPPPQGEGEQDEVRPELQRAPEALDRDEVERMFAWLEAKEREKQDLRRVRRQELGRGVEKDW